MKKSITTENLTNEQRMELIKQLEKEVEIIKEKEKKIPVAEKQDTTSQEKQFENAVKYLYENFDFVMGEDGNMYWGDKGTHVMVSDLETLKNRVGIYAQPGTTTTTKTIREDSVFYIKDDLLRDIDNKKSKKFSFQPRVMKDKDDNIWIDTGQGNYNSNTPGAAGFIKISNDGSWKMNCKPVEDIYFYRNSNVGSLEINNTGNINDIKLFFKHVNIPENMMGNAIAFIINSIVSPEADQPVLFIQGQQGSGKTTTAERIKQIFFPTVDLGQEESKSGLPDSISDMNALLKQDGLPFYDNLTGMPLTMSDAICRVATGAGFSTRKLYSDSDLSQTKYRRAQILTSVDQITMRPDLQTRTIFIEPPKLQQDGGNYQLGSLMKRAWYNDLPTIRAAFLSLAAEVLKRKNEKIDQSIKENITLKFKTRLSDFEFTSMICDEILIENGIFSDDYNSVDNREITQKELQHASVPSVIDFLINSDDINIMKEMKISQILDHIRNTARENGTPVDYFPRSGRGLSPIINDNMEVLKEYFDIKIEIDNRSKQKLYTFNRKIVNKDVEQETLFTEKII